MPSERPLPNPTTVPTASPTTLSPVTPAQLFSPHSFSCFADCVDFASSFGMSAADTCVFLAGIFDRCDSYSVAFGLCPVVTCAADCDLADWCYFASGSVTSCPYEDWSGATTAAQEIHAQCLSSMTAGQQQSLADDEAAAVQDSSFHLSRQTLGFIIGNM